MTGVVANHGGQDVGQRQDARADRPGLPAKPARGERQDRVLDVGGDHARGEPAGQLDRIVEPHHEVARIERHSGDRGSSRSRTAISSSPVRSAWFSIATRIPRSLSRGVSRLMTSMVAVDLLVPGIVEPKAVVAVADEYAGLAA